MSLYKSISLSSLTDSRGGLIAIESFKNIPFDIKRVYYLFGTDITESRGYHAHKNLKQLLICVSGSCEVTVDDGEGSEVVLLENPDQALLIEGLIWREMHNFSEGCVLLAIASELYDESDYIRNYDDFVSYSKQVKGGIDKCHS